MQVGMVKKNYRASGGGWFAGIFPFLILLFVIFFNSFIF
jgi:hypothetical protein